MRPIAAQKMTALLTRPYQRGGETLDIPLGADAAGFTAIPSYTFREYRARYGEDPALPRYVVYPLTNIPGEGTDLDIRFTQGGPEQSVTIHLPGGTLAGTSVAIPTPAGANASLVLTRFRQSPAPLPGTGQQNFGIVALLGNIAKLAWVLGWEKDQIRINMQDVARQRHVALAHGASLDALGADLRVPRFPPRPYSFDTSTLALYHLDSVVANAGVVADDTTRFGLPGNPGVNQNCVSGVTAKFGNGFRIPGPGATGNVEIPSAALFDLPAAANFTAEIFLKAAASAAPALVMGKGTLDNSGSLTGPGWSLMLGPFRDVPNNLRWAGSDGANQFVAFADLNLADSQFHHIAAVIDRASARAILYVDGVVLNATSIAALGALTNAQTIRIGRSTVGHQLSGVFDEIRFSSIARQSFDPVLREDDNSYRQRLAIFRRWQSPTPADVLQTINSAVQINGQPDSFVLIEQTRGGASGSALVRVVPPALAPGQSIAADGTMPANEAGASGSPADDTDFNPSLLVVHNSPQVNYGTDPNNTKMQACTARALNHLLALLAAQSPAIAGLVTILKSYDPQALGLHPVGRALQLTHNTLTLPQLAHFAHRAGFDFVRNDSTAIYCSLAAAEKLAITADARAAAEIPLDGSDLFQGHAMDVHLAQTALPANGLTQWVVIASGNGRVTLLPHSADPVTLTTPVASRRRVRIQADLPGDLALRVEYTLNGITVTGTLPLRITVNTLADAQSIAADGSLTESEADASGTVPVTALNPDYLITSTLPINFGAAPNNRMQLAAEKPLIALVGLLTASGAAAAQLDILKAFTPADPTLLSVGRALQFTHPAVDPGALAAFAHQAGFDFVRRDGANVYASVAAGDLIEIAQSPALTPLPTDLIAGTPVNLRARFTTLPAAGEYNWSTAIAGNGTGSFNSVLTPAVAFTPIHTGSISLSVSYSENDASKALPYTFEIRLKPSLDIPATIIPKTQYDLLMNILNYFHPIGVEVITQNVRQHVVEVRENLLSSFPGYTYPDFRI